MRAKLGDVTMRAGHHLMEAAPLIPVIAESFRKEGFKVRPLKTRLYAITPDGTIYVVARGRGYRTQVIVYRKGQSTHPVVEFDLGPLFGKVRSGDYDQVRLFLRGVAKKVRMAATF